MVILNERPNLDIIQFLCPHCQAELGVPSHLAGTVAPCPMCYAPVAAPNFVNTLKVGIPIRPKVAAVPAPTDSLLEIPEAKILPSAAPTDAHPSILPTAKDTAGNQFSWEVNEPEEAPTFVATRVIAPSDAPLDASWKDTVRRRSKQKAIKRTVAKRIEGFLDSTFFRWAKITFFVLGLAFVAYTYRYMKKHGMRTWWQDPPPARKVTPPGAEKA